MEEKYEKILCLFLAVCLLMMHVTALAEEEIVPGAGVVIGQPDGMNILAGYTTADGFHKPEGSTPWSFERATPNTDEYQNLTYYGSDVSGGWFDQEYLDWAHGAVHYPVAMHLQKAYEGLGLKEGDLPVAEMIAAQELSLPMFYGITDEQIEQVCYILNKW